MSQLQHIVIDPQQLDNGKVLLTFQQQHYLGRVLRLRDGDRLILMDGISKWWLAELIGEQVQILELLTVKTELPTSITLMVALPKGNGLDEIVRCCTELGVATIIPVLSDRTLLNPSPQKLERWRRIATEAAEQSERTLVPTILEPLTWITAISEWKADHQYICVARGEHPHLQTAITNPTKEIVIATGPEGGWTGKEVETAIAHGFQPISLGGRILRAVTAPIVALSLLSGIIENSPS
jgi:16S rRNA (uracil1498-N3)-methyltransferase